MSDGVELLDPVALAAAKAKMPRAVEDYAAAVIVAYLSALSKRKTNNPRAPKTPFGHDYGEGPNISSLFADGDPT